MRYKFFLKQNKYLLLILGTAVLLRAVFFIIILRNFGDAGFYPYVNEDAGQYLRMTQNLLKYHFFSMDIALPLAPESFRPPGYPFFVSIFYRIIPTAWFVIVFQNIVALLIIILIYRIVTELFKKKAVALIASIIYAIEPGVIYWNNQLLSETLFVFILLFCVYLFIRYFVVRKKYLFPTALATGALLAVASYVRTVAQFILPIFIIISFADLKINFKNFIWRFIVVTLMIASFLVMALPWLMRNKALINTYDFTSASGGVGLRRQAYYVALNRGDNLDEIAALEKSASIKYVVSHPVTFTKINLLSFMPFLMSDGYFTVASTIYPPLEKIRVLSEWSGSWRELKNYLSGHRGLGAVIFFVGKATLLTLNIFAFVGIIFWLFVLKKHRIAALLFLLLIYYFILGSGVTAYSRLRQPVIPYIFIFAALGIHWFLFKLRRTKFR